jgi:glycosyltransferase involved in cell wall biosynthesis
MIWGLMAIPRIPWKKTPVVIYSASPLLPDIIAAFIARLVKGKSVFWAVCLAHLILKPSDRGGRRLTDTVSYLSQQVGNALIKYKGDIVIVDTKMMKEELITRGFCADRIFVTSFGAGDRSHRESVPFQYDACFLGRVHPSKGLADLVRIWGRVCEKRPGSKLAIVGTGDMLNDLRLQVRSAGLEEQILILGYLPRPELEQVMASSKVFVFPSREEGFGISLVEAMSFGLPVVAYALPHYPEVFGDIPMTAPIGDEMVFAKLVLDLLEDDALRQRKSLQGKTLASNYSWPEVTRREVAEIAGRATNSLPDLCATKDRAIEG